jgi:DNA-binding IclR family transcriptional regulator
MPGNGSTATGGVLQSARRTLSALDALSHYPDGAMAKALSADLGLHLSTTYHLLNSLVATGYAVQDPISRHFRLGPRIPHLNQAFVATLQPQPAVLSLLQVLQETIAETVHLGRLLGHELVATVWVAGTRSDAVPVGYIGMSGPAHATAAGRAILAALPASLLDDFLAEADLSEHGPFPATDRATLDRELALVRERGYAVDRGDRSSGVVGCLAALVERADSIIPDVITVMAPRSRFLREESTLLAAVAAVAQAASALAHTTSSDGPSMRDGNHAPSILEQAMAAARPYPLADELR